MSAAHATREQVSLKWVLEGPAEAGKWITSLPTHQPLPFPSINPTEPVSPLLALPPNLSQRSLSSLPRVPLHLPSPSSILSAVSGSLFLLLFTVTQFFLAPFRRLERSGGFLRLFGLSGATPISKVGINTRNKSLPSRGIHKLAANSERPSKLSSSAARSGAGEAAKKKWWLSRCQGKQEVRR